MLNTRVARKLLPVLVSAFFAHPLLAQFEHSDTLTVYPPNGRNVWASAGIGAGTGGFSWIRGAWLASDNFVLGYRRADVAGWFEPDFHDHTLLVGLRHRGFFRQALIAAGPARLGGHRDGGETRGPRIPTETGIALGSELGLVTPLFGIGFDLFAARSKSIKFVGLTLSLQAGWFGNSR